MGSGASNPAGKEKPEAGTVTQSNKAAPKPTKDARRASFIPNLDNGKGKSSKTDEESSALHADEALKVTIHNDASRRAFMKFLQKQGSGHDHILNYYFEIDDIKASKNNDVAERGRHLHQRYSSYQTSSPELLRPVWKQVLEYTQPPAEDPAHDQEDVLSTILEQFKTAQLFIVTNMSPILAEFYTSDVYKEFENTKSHQEGALLRPSMGGPSAPPAATGPNASIQLPNNTYPKHFPKILVVDDSSVAAKVSMLGLKKNGHDVKVAVNGRKCVEMCAEEQFDVVLVDLYMPIMDGFETMTQLKAARAVEGGDSEGKKGKYPLLIAMSADWDKDTEGKAVVSGADSFLEKPFNVEKLSAILVKFLPSASG